MTSRTPAGALLSTRDIAAKYGLRNSSVARYIVKTGLPFFKIGQRFFVDEAEWGEYLSKSYHSNLGQQNEDLKHSKR